MATYFYTNRMLNTNIDTTDIRILGLMTGSSADGLDLCLVHFTGEPLSPCYEVLFTGEIPYPVTFQTAFRNPLRIDEDQIKELHEALGTWFANQISQLGLQFDCIASHGQTIKHEPPHYSLQIGNPRYMAEKFQVPVIYDFRTADILQGGQGAPLIPIVDHFLLKGSQDVLALNIGGISNLTVIPGENSLQPVLAWDTGPGNSLIDKAVRLYSKDKLNYDPEGTIAASGKSNTKLLKYLLKHKFYSIIPPRSAGQEQFGLDYFNQILKEFYPATDQEFKDFIRTLTVLTAKTIANSINDLLKLYSPNKLFVSGGGFYNSTLIGLLELELPDLQINELKLPGINPKNKEAFGFAYLGHRSLNNLTGNIPSVTGARKKVVLGKILRPGL
ncbi:MAG: anhydro-N-acetylmuramic acid kinase [Candidatus Marinimicrobia bacterium]|nr:anhydro-N-acetylmuramic acid kinase [Candidatus Neomarinimicrobiota bacterium]